MPSTARLLTAIGSSAIHAHRPGEDDTLCGLTVIDPEEYDGDDSPPRRSADFTGRRYYIGIHRLMCQRCTDRAIAIRMDPELVSVPMPVSIDFEAQRVM